MQPSLPIQSHSHATPTPFPRPVDLMSVAAPDCDGPNLPGDRVSVYQDIVDLSGFVIRRLSPDRVIAWLYCASYDIFDVAQRLAAGGFEGRLTVVCWPLPRPKMVAREIATAFPSLKIDLIQHEDTQSGNRDYEHSLRAASSA